MYLIMDTLLRLSKILHVFFYLLWAYYREARQCIYLYERKYLPESRTVYLMFSLCNIYINVVKLFDVHVYDKRVLRDVLLHIVLRYIMSVCDKKSNKWLSIQEEIYNIMTQCLGTLFYSNNANNQSAFIGNQREVPRRNDWVENRSQLAADACNNQSNTV